MFKVFVNAEHKTFYDGETSEAIAFMIQSFSVWHDGSQHYPLCITIQQVDARNPDA